MNGVILDFLQGPPLIRSRQLSVLLVLSGQQAVSGTSFRVVGGLLNAVKISMIFKIMMSYKQQETSQKAKNCENL
jgi:hypothetical protein